MAGVIFFIPLFCSAISFYACSTIYPGNNPLNNKKVSLLTQSYLPNFWMSKKEEKSFFFSLEKFPRRPKEKRFFLILLSFFVLIHLPNPQPRPVVIIISTNICPSVLSKTFKIQAKQTNIHEVLRLMLFSSAASGTYDYGAGRVDQ